MALKIDFTNCPFGLKEINDNYYLFCILKCNDEGHMKIKKKIYNLERKIKNENKKYIFRTNLYTYKDKDKDNNLLKIRIKKNKKNLNYDIEYKNNSNYLKTIHNVEKTDCISLYFKIGNIYVKKYQDNNNISIPLYLTKIIFE